MATTAEGRTPTHLWIVGILALLWNAFGCYDYLMTKTRNMDYLASIHIDLDRMLAWINSMPIYAQFGWGLWVWTGIVGSALLLARSRYAVHAFALSAAGAVANLGWQMMDLSAPPEVTQGFMKYVPALVILLAVAQLWYAWHENRSGVLG
jgi:hypothetical protein